MQDVVNGWLSMFYGLVNGLFTLEFVSGVSFGSFLLVVLIFGIMISFLFRKIFKW